MGDRVLEVDGVSVRDKTAEELTNLIVGRSVPVHVTIERDPLQLIDDDNTTAGPGLPDGIAFNMPTGNNIKSTGNNIKSTDNNIKSTGNNRVHRIKF